MTIRTHRRRGPPPGPRALLGVIRDVGFDRQPLIAGEPIVASLPQSSEQIMPWAASLEYVLPDGQHCQHWAQPASGGLQRRMRFSPPTDDDGQPLTGLLAAFIRVWHVPDPTAVFHRVPITPRVGLLLDLRPAEKASKQG